MRLFLAIETSPETRRALASIQKGLSRFDRSVRWTQPERMHLTLKFLGEVEDSRLTEIVEACRLATVGGTEFEMRLTECGCFPPAGRVNVVWVGVATEGEVLSTCQARVEDRFAEIGFPPENRPFTPHLTIGRVKSNSSDGALRKAVADVRELRVVQPVGELVLMESELKPSGPEYAVVGRFPLSG